jgi:hypothetical protein
MNMIKKQNRNGRPIKEAAEKRSTNIHETFQFTHRRINLKNIEEILP